MHPSYGRLNVSNAENSTEPSQVSVFTHGKVCEISSLKIKPIPKKDIGSYQSWWYLWKIGIFYYFPQTSHAHLSHVYSRYLSEYDFSMGSRSARDSIAGPHFALEKPTHRSRVRFCVYMRNLYSRLSHEDSTKLFHWNQSLHNTQSFSILLHSMKSFVLYRVECDLLAGASWYLCLSTDWQCTKAAFALEFFFCQFNPNELRSHSTGTMLKYEIWKTALVRIYHFYGCNIITFLLRSSI